LTVQWAVLLVLGAVYFGCTWWMEQRRARDEGRDASAPPARGNVFPRSFEFSDWAVTMLRAPGLQECARLALEVIRAGLKVWAVSYGLIRSEGVVPTAL
jgi:hypothetical protein